MKKNDITTREDIAILVTSFYQKVRANQDIGTFFNETITDWPAHIDRLTDFWETNLLFVRKYKGNPFEVHAKVDATFDNSLEQEHFGIWLNLWFETIDSLFTGDNAQTAKRRARKMSSFMYLKIFESRVQSTKY